MAQQIGRLARSTLIYGLGQVLIRFISLLLLPLFTSYLTPAEYGVSAILGLIVSVVSPVFMLGLGAAIGMYFHSAENAEQRNQTIWTSFVILLVSSLLLAILSVAFGPQISEIAFQTSAHHMLVTISLLSVCLVIAATPFQLFLQLEERAIVYVAITIAVSLVSIGLSIVAVVYLRRGIAGLVEANFFTQALAFVLFLAPTARSLSFRFNSQVGRDMLRAGVPLIPGFAFLFLITQGNKYILQWLDGLDAVGVYSIGFNIGMVMNLVVVAFTTAWTPYFLTFSDKQDEAKILFGRLMTYYVMGFGALTLVFFIVAKPLIMLMTAPAFHDTFVVIGPSAAAQYFLGVFSLLLPAMYFAHEVSYVTVIQAIAATIALALNFMLIPAMGIVGAGIALALGTLAVAVVQQFWNERRPHYLAVTYEWNRVVKFAVVFSVYSSFFLWNRSLSLGQEILLSAIALWSLPTVLLLLLTRSERTGLWANVKRLTQLPGRLSSAIRF